MSINVAPVPGTDPGNGMPMPPVPPNFVPPVQEPEPDRLPDEEPLPNPDENDGPSKWARNLTDAGSE